MTTERDLIQQLTERLDHLHSNYDLPSQSALIAEALDYLDQPEPEGPTDEELCDLMYEFTISTGHGSQLDEIGFARAVLARWGK